MEIVQLLLCCWLKLWYVPKNAVMLTEIDSLTEMGAIHIPKSNEQTSI